MSNNPPFVQQALDRFEKNRGYLKEHMPNLFEAIENSGELKKCRLDILHDLQEFDLVEEKISLYSNGANKYASSETRQFLQQLRPGAPLKTVAPATPGLYEIPRFFARHLDKTINDSFPRSYNPLYNFPSFFPLITFMGVGLGLHIEKVINERDCHQILIIENNAEHLICSLYVTDWYKIIPKFKLNEGKSIQFILFKSVKEEEIFSHTWNELLSHVPHFPTAAIFYNHRRQNLYQKVIDRIHKDLNVFMGAWGNYDDEVNQLNNALHNLKSKIPVSRNTKDPVEEDLLEIPVFIIGAGPSLNEHIDFIKENQKKAIVLSSGTALSILHHHNIKPDIHIEIESDYCTVAALKNLKDDAYLRSIPIIGPIQLNPLAFKLFDRKYLFFKDSTSLSKMFSKDGEILIGTTPTCTNAATSIALSHGFKNVFFMGMDYGYRDKKESHAKGSIWYRDDKPVELKRSQVIQDKDPEIRVRAVGGGEVLTKQIYYSSKRRLEDFIKHHPDSNIYNLSNGAEIVGTKEINLNKAYEIVSQINNNKDDALNYLLPDKARIISDSDISKGLEELTTFLTKFSDYTNSLVDKIGDDFTSLSKGLFLISFNLEHYHRINRKGSNYYFIRGAIWHYIYAAMSMALLAADEANQKESIKQWKNRFKDFLKKIDQHLGFVINKDRENEDTWLKSSILESIDEPDYWK